MNSLKVLRWLLLISGIFIVVLGIGMAFTPLANLLTLAIYIGISVLFSGIAEIASFISEEKGKKSGWLLVSGILSVLLSFWVLFGKGIVALSVALPFVVAVWVLSSGLMRISGSFSLKSLGSKKWGWFLAFGILSTLLGFILMFSPVMSALFISYLFAFMFISHGINNIILFFNMKNL